MTTFFIIVLGLLVVRYLFTKKSSIKLQEKPSTPKPPKKAPKIVKNTSEKHLYKKKSIREFDIKGASHRNLSQKDSGGFLGHVHCENNSHDKYAVGVYNEKGVQLGYVPKGNEILHNSLNEWYKGKSLCWGYIEYDDFYRKWIGRVYIPVKYTVEEIGKFEEFLKFKHLNEEQIKSKANTTEEYFQILERHKKIQKNLQDLKITDTPYYYFPKNFIPTVSKQLEKQKEWDKLIELEAYDDLISDLNDQFRATTERRIKLAKSKKNENF